MAVLYMTTYICPICNFEKYYVGQEYEEPLEPFVCCAPMIKKAFKPLRARTDAEKIEYPVLFKEARRILKKDMIAPIQQKRSMENLEFTINLSYQTRRVLSRISSHYGSTYKGLNMFVNDAILYYEQYLHILQSPELYKIAIRFDEAKYREIKLWLSKHRSKKYERIFAEEMPSFSDMLKEVLYDDEDISQLKDLEQDSKDIEDGLDN